MTAVSPHADSSPDLAEILVHARRPFTAAVVQAKIERQGADWGEVVFYVDVRAVIDRLNLLLPGRWHADLDLVDHSPPPAAGTDPALVYRCRLTAGDAVHTDVGEGFDHKAARSDALKRAAIHLGIGHCLWRIDPIRIAPGPGRDQLRGEAPLFTLDDANRRWLRGRYQAWLTRAGIAEYGLPLDHGDAARAIAPELFPERSRRARPRRSGPATAEPARPLEPATPTPPAPPRAPAASATGSDSARPLEPVDPASGKPPARPLAPVASAPPAIPAASAAPAGQPGPARRLAVVADLPPARRLAAVADPPREGARPSDTAAVAKATPRPTGPPPVAVVPPPAPAAPAQRAALLEIAARLGYGVLTVEALAACVYDATLEELGEDALHGVRSYLDSAAAGRVADRDLAARIAQGTREAAGGEPARDRLARWLLAREERAAAEPA